MLVPGFEVCPRFAFAVLHFPNFQPQKALQADGYAFQGPPLREARVREPTSFSFPLPSPCLVFLIAQCHFLIQASLGYGTCRHSECVQENLSSI